MFPGKKIKEHMESEFSSIFEVKLVVKNGAWVHRDPFDVYEA